MEQGVVARASRQWPGRLALASGVVTALAVAAGIWCAEAGLHLAAWTAGVFAIVTSLVAVLAGVTATIGGWARAAGVAGLALGVAANPVVLTRGLDLAAGL